MTERVKHPHCTNRRGEDIQRCVTLRGRPRYMVGKDPETRSIQDLDFKTKGVVHSRLLSGFQSIPANLCEV